MSKQDLSARHFTTSAIHIVEQLKHRAADRGMLWEIDAPMITMLALWSLLRWERKVGLVALERLGIEPDALAQAVNQALSTACSEKRRQGERPKYQILPSGQKAIVIDFDTPLEQLLVAAESEALAMNHNYVGSEHLLLAAIQQACPRLHDVLQTHGVTHARVMKAVIDVLRG
jgi:ATP-dependent Clp protease ATP-binding subunit ClpA